MNTTKDSIFGADPNNSFGMKNPNAGVMPSPFENQYNPPHQGFGTTAMANNAGADMSGEA